VGEASIADVLSGDDVTYVTGSFAALDDLCREHGRDADAARRLVAAGRLPRPSYTLPDGTEMVPRDWLDLANAAERSGEEPEALFRRRYAAAAERHGVAVDEPLLASEWEGHLSGDYGVCLRAQTPENVCAKGARMRAIEALIAAPAPADAAWRAALAEQVGALDALERPFAAYDRVRWGPVSRDRLIFAVRERWPEAFAPNADVLAFVRAELPAPPARVLEVGAGAGELATALRGLGYDVVAIDPAASAPEVLPVALLDLDAGDGSFDAAVAVLSLHHVEPLEASCRRLAEVVRPGGRLVVDEMDVAALDARAAGWWAGHHGDHAHADHASDPAAMVTDMQAHLHPARLVRAALEPGFELGPVERGPYLHRWDLPPALRDEEAGLIAAGRLPATGARFTGTRRA
jgi:SAM-dependent methyltransferase